MPRSPGAFLSPPRELIPRESETGDDPLYKYKVYPRRKKPYPSAGPHTQYLSNIVSFLCVFEGGGQKIPIVDLPYVKVYNASRKYNSSNPFAKSGTPCDTRNT